MKKHYLFLIVLMGLLISPGLTAQTISETYISGDIPTSYSGFDATCTGPVTTISLELPVGGPWEVTGFDVEYDMTAASGAYMSEQRSFIYFQNNNIGETNPSQGTGFGGTYGYERTNVDIANGYYTGGEELIFEMRAWRTWGASPACGTNYNKVNDGTWVITVYYQLAPSCIPPGNIAIANIDTQEAEASWVEIGTATLWNIEYGEAGFTQGSGTLVSGLVDNTYLMAGLDPETEYDFYVQSDCGGGDESTWSGPYTFETLIACPVATNVQLEDITTVSAAFSWEVSPNETGGYTWVLMESGDDPDLDTPVENGTTTSGTTQVTVVGLNSETAYQFYIKADCGVDGQSSWAGPVSFTTPFSTAIEALGFNADVIANGVGTMGSSTSDDVDGANFCFLSQDWKLNIGDPDLTVGLPGNGLVINSGVVYQMSPFSNPYEGNNSLRVETNNAPATLSLVAPTNYESLYFLVTSGSGSSNVSVEVNFNDASSQTFTGITIPDWYGSGLPIEASGFGRGNISNDNVEAPSGNPKLFRLTVDMDLANQGKTVNSVTFTKTNGGVLNVFAISGKEAEDCMPPTNLMLDVITDSTAEISWNQSFTETDGYVWFLMTPGDDPDVDAPLDSGTTATGIIDLTISGLNSNTGYDFYIKTDCNIDGQSSWAGPLNFETLETCPAPANLQSDDVTNTTAEMSWDASFNESGGYSWVLMAPGDDPDIDTPIDSNTTATGITNITLSGLTSATEYDFYIKTGCGTNGESSWTGPLNFITQALSISDTYLSGDIPTSYQSFDPTCNGPVTTLSVELPSGGPWEVIGVDIEYAMTGTGWMSDQRSAVYCQNTQNQENTQTNSNNFAGTQQYNRADVAIANGFYPDGAELVFEMRAWRTWNDGSPNCGTNLHKVDNNTWTVTVYYQLAPSCILPQNIEISNISPYEADATWTQIGTVNSWNIEYGEAGFTPGGGTLVSGLISNAYQMTGLDPETEYDFYVQADCGGGDESAWAGPYTFETLIACQAPTNVQLDDLAVNYAGLTWNASPDETGYTWALMAPGDNPDTETPLETAITGTGITQVTVTGLDPETGYDFYVKTDCGIDGASSWTGPLNFTTPIITVAIEVSGLNSDVIANGVGAMSSSTTNDVDGVNYCFFSENWKLNAGDPDLTVGLPEAGVINSSGISGLEYQMSPFSTPYEGNNSLRINSDNIPESLTLTTPASYMSLYLLVTSGSGSSGMDLEVNFSDGTSESFTGYTVPDWFGAGLPVEASGFGRGNLNNNNVETPFGNPKLFRLTVDIDSANQNKIIDGITFTKTNGGVINVFAVSGKTINACLVPTNLTLENITENSADVSWNIAYDDVNGYIWSLMVSGDDPDIDTPADSGITATGVTDVSITGLNPETGYDFYVKTDCDTNGVSGWAGPVSFETLETCPAPANVQLDNVTEDSADISWDASSNEVNGYIWSLMGPGDDPDMDTPVDSGIITTGITNVLITGLIPETGYDFYVKADCDTDGESNWTGPFNFETMEACPAPTSVQLDNVTDITVDISWNVSPNEVNGYNWALMQPGDDPDINTPLQNGNTVPAATDVTITGLSDNTEYDFYIQTNCSGNESIWAGPLNFTTVEFGICAYTTLELTGFNADVVAEGTGANADTKVSHHIDITNVLYAQDFVPLNPHSSGSSAAAYGGGLPNDGLIQSSATTGLEFQINSYGVNNALLLRNDVTNTGTLTLTQQKKAEKIYLIWFTAEGSNNVDVSVNFADGTSQVFANQTPVDWWSTSPNPSIVALGQVGRVSTGAWTGAPLNSFSGLTQTQVFQQEFQLDVANYNKSISSVSFTKTSGSANATTAILAVSICQTFEVAGCASPTALILNEIDSTTVEVSWDASSDETSGYNWMLMYQGDNPYADVPLQNGNVTTTNVTVSSLDENTNYVFYVQTDCDPDGESTWSPITFIIEGEGTTCENAIEVTTLPYVHTDTTANYLNNYSGAPGSSCGTSDNYLNGYDVVYQFTPTTDMAVNIDLSDLAGFYAGIFVYGSCSDIGINCIAGAVNSASDNNFGIIDLELEANEDYFIVVSSWLNPSIDYTITISESVCPQPANLTMSNLTGTGVTFFWDPSSNEQNGYEWALMDQGDHPDTDTPLDTDTTASGVTDITLTGMSPTTSYSFYVRADCAIDGYSGWTGPVNFQTPITTGDIPTSYNAYDGTCNGPNYTLSYELPASGGPWVVTGIDVEYTMTAANGAWMSEQRSLIHSQNTGIGETSAAQGTGNGGGTFSYSRQNVDIANGTYPDGEELIFEMRAWRTWSSFGQDGCTTYNNKVDDNTWEITVYYEPAPTCPAVGDLSVVDTADDEMEVSWTETGTAAAWNIEYGPIGFVQGSGTVEAVTTNPYTIDGLTPGSEYDVYVQADCGTGDTSDWSGPVTVGVGIPSDTYNDGDIPTSYLGFDATCNGPNTTLSINLPSTGGPWEVIGVDIEYTMTASNGAYMSEQRSAIYSQNTGEQESTASGTGLGGTFQYNRTNVDIANGYYPDGEELIFEMRAWRTWGASPDCGTNYSKVDDGSWTITVYYMEAPSCLPVQDAFIVATAADELEVSWTEIGSATEWNIEYGEPGFSQGSGTMVTGITNIPYTITGLDPELEYEVYIQADCGGGDLGDWTGPVVDNSGVDCENPMQIWNLPYVTQDNTANYGDDYDGSPGTSCGSTSGYLNGDDVVYHFVPDENMEITILLTDIGSNYAGIFIYEDCEDIGDTCVGGMLNGATTTDLEILDFPVVDGQSYYIVISTWAAPQSTSYTLSITKNCLVYPDTPIGDANQGLCIGATISDIDVTGDNIRWYANETDVVPLTASTELQDGETYYASQVIDGCESDVRLEVTVTLLEPSDIPTGNSNQTYVEGETIADLEVVGDNLIWYEDAEGMITIPESTPLVDQTAYYVSQTPIGYCESDLLKITVYEVLTIEEVLFGELFYYPNPVEGVLTIVNTIPMDMVEIYTILGQKVISKNIDFEETTIDMRELASGTYFLKVSIDEKASVYRIIKE